MFSLNEYDDDDDVANDISLMWQPSLVVFHHDRTSPIQYVLFVPVEFNQSDSCMLSDGRSMLVKTANDPPRDKQSLLALYHDTDKVRNIL